jgi:tartrate dehydrogenase/decarboxylase / D-malate dehydrogenase
MDALAGRIVSGSDALDVVVASNLFATFSRISQPRSRRDGNGRQRSVAREVPPGIFELVEGSAPDIAGWGIADPAGAIWTAALMLEHARRDREACCVLDAAGVLCRDAIAPFDIRNSGSTAQMGDAVARQLARIVRA